MSSDIVERLRNWDDGRVSTHYEGCWDSHPVCAILLAADAIEARDAEIARLRAAGDALAGNFRRHVMACGVNDGRESLSAWEEARRGAD